MPSPALLPMNSPQVLQSEVLGQDEDHGVVAVPAAGVDGNGGRLVDNDQVIILGNDLDLFRRHGHFMSAEKYFKSEQQIGNISTAIIILSGLLLSFFCFYCSLIYDGVSGAGLETVIVVNIYK